MRFSIQLTLQQPLDAGISLRLWEVFLLATRYAACDCDAPCSWAAPVRWPALLRDLGVTPDGHLPAGRTASLADIGDLLTNHAPNVRSPSSSLHRVFLM